MFGPVLILFENAEPFLQAMGIVNEFMTVDASRKLFIPPLIGQNGKLPSVVDTLYIYSELLV